MSDVPFFDRLVHDLKGPLSPLQTAAYLLRRGELPAERRGELLDTVERQARRLGLMIEEAGDWARATSGRLVNRRVACDFALLLDMSVVGFATHSIEPRIAPELRGAQVLGDETRLQQLLSILIGHAIARDAAAPALIAHREDGRALVEVSDRGPPLSAELAAGLFSQPSPEPYDEGLGLRLLIAQAIARAHDGELEALPGGETGLTVRCRLPLAAAA